MHYFKRVLSGMNINYEEILRIFDFAKPTPLENTAGLNQPQLLLLLHCCVGEVRSQKRNQIGCTVQCPPSCGIWKFSLARTAPSGGAVLGRLAAGVVVIWAEDATRGCHLLLLC
jgi:hypothetical protein